MGGNLKKSPKKIEFCSGNFDYPDASFRTIARCTNDTFVVKLKTTLPYMGLD